MTIKATFKSDDASCAKDDTCPMSAFTDLDKNAWYHDGIHFVLDNGIMSGYGKGKFAPDDTTSRAMVAQLLWNMEGKPVVNYAMNYTDVAKDAWYADAIRFATAQGLMSGYGNGKFGPNDAMTREQLVALMYRYAQLKNADVTIGEDTNILSYGDVQTVSEWAIPAMQWACGSGILNGIDGNLVPAGKASRAQVATMIMRFITSIAK
ncbi:MAG: S-layer homology domain-containing protein [Clostridia bacterium]|nr:S-layer homology domain-containing protein [Clostridia bacterium]